MEDISGFLPQYAAQAAFDLEDMQKKLKGKGRELAHSGAPMLQSVLGHLIQMIRTAVHVVLPANGEIYRSNFRGGDCPSSDECDSFSGIPAPVTCFEYPWTHYANGETRAPKRITLIIDHKQLLYRPVPEGHVTNATIISLCFSEMANCWSVGTHISLNAVTPLKADTNSQGLWGVRGTMTNLLTGEEYTDQNKPELDSSGLKLIDLVGELLPDVTAVVQCCHALRAGASLEEKTESSSARRWKMEKRGVGGFTYHVLKLPQRAVSSRSSECGSHASPRLHVRRAHIRKLPTGTLTFVRQCFVGDADKGVVDKHYSVGKGGER